MSNKPRKINKDTSHLWANRIPGFTYSKTPGGRLFFDGDTIYSYGRHFRIARHVQKKTTNGYAILFTTREHSVTTAKHKHEVRLAIPNYVTVFHVDNVAADNRSAHLHNIKCIDKEISAASIKLKRARANKDGILGRIKYLIEQRNGYVKFFGLRLKPFTAEDGDRLQQAALRAEKREVDNNRRARAKAEKNAQDRIKQWVAGESVIFPYSVGRIYLRQHRIGGVLSGIETSRNAVVPYDHAKRAFKLAQKLREEGKSYVRNGHSEHVGHYTIDKIDSDGSVHIGCHHIEWAEIEALATKEGWI